VGEFHYLHHAPGGKPYPDPNLMSRRLLDAARAAGIRITLLDACYVRGGLDGRPLQGAQLRFGDGSAEAWAARVDALGEGAGMRLGAAVHSVRAVDEAGIKLVASWAAAHEAPLHVHLSEQRAENDACLAASGRTPSALLDEHGALGADSTAVHATHLSDGDIGLLGRSATTICMCPTTERDLADGIGPARALADAGAPLSVGSDSNAVVDLFEEARGVELDERLASERRGHWSAAALLDAATGHGYASLGWREGGRLAPGALADFVTVGLGSVRLAGTRPATALESLVFAAGAADVREVVVAGRRVVAGGRHTRIDDVPAALDSAITAVLL
jgi:formiminoglutamate deiminase